MHLARALTVLSIGGLLSTFGVPTVSALADQGLIPGSHGPRVLYHFKLPNGNKATAFNNGVVQIITKAGRPMIRKIYPVAAPFDDVSSSNGIPDRSQMLRDLAKGQTSHPFAEGRVIVVFRDGVRPNSDSFRVSAAKLRAMRLAPSKSSGAWSAPNYTNETGTNALLATMGVAKSERLFQKFNRAALSTMSANARTSTLEPTLNLSNAYRLHITAMSVRDAVGALAKSPAVAYASPDWLVGSMKSRSIPLPSDVRQAASRMRIPSATRTVMGNGSSRMGAAPTNYALTTSAQSLLNSPSTNAAAAFDEIRDRYRELPGQGEIITNVSVGDLDDASVATNTSDPCNNFVTTFGPTTIMMNGQRYIDWPSMPLIAAYSSDANGNLSGSAEVCGQDPLLGEVGLDFSMMAPLPHDRQRTNAAGLGLTDLLGIAPGATYRLVVPQNSSPTTTDVDTALLGAALQNPRPSVITASLGFGFDGFGFPDRYLEEDPLAEAIIASIVYNYNVVVCISSNDGTRTFTNVAIGPSGGSAPTEQIAQGKKPTDLNDVGFSTAPSRVFDSGSIDVGGTTLDDIFAAPPQNPEFSRLSSQHAFAETRWTGFTDFSSGFGSRVNVSAPSDNVLAFSHSFGGAANAVDVSLSGGTSASAPEVAAAAAVALQVARLTGSPFRSATDVRDFLARTGTNVPRVPQSDVYNNVGPQIDVAKIVEALLEKAGKPVEPQVSRVAIEQRRNFAVLDGAFLSATDPSNIDLQGPVSRIDGTNTGRNQTAWITIAPDWEGLPRNAQFRLNVVGRYASPLAATRWARLSPAQILRAAGLPLASSSSRTVNLRYRAFTGMHLLAERIFSLTFGPAESTTRGVLAPIAPAEARGATIPVTYNLEHARNVQNPVLVVSEPGRVDPATGLVFHPSFSLPLPRLSGTVQVPVNRLQGGGVYGIGILYGHLASGNCTDLVGNPISCPLYTDFAFTRVAGAGTARPQAPLLSSGDSLRAHFLHIAYGEPLRISWDVSAVLGATGGLLEISSPGPPLFFNLNTFNNPNGSILDRNAIDVGSIKAIPVAGVSGASAFKSLDIGLVPSFNHVVRIIPTNGGRIIGEAGDVSSVSMDGVTTPDGGNVTSGYSLNPEGRDGLITSENDFSGFPYTHSLYTFDQITGKLTGAIDTNSFDPTDPTAIFKRFQTLGNEIYSSDVGLYQVYGNDNATRSFGYTYGALDPVMSANNPSSWKAPHIVPPYFVPAFHGRNRDAAFLENAHPNTRPDAFKVFTSNVASNTFGPEYDVTRAIAKCPGPFPSVVLSSFADGFDEDLSTSTAIVDTDGGCLVTVNLKTGRVNTIQPAPGRVNPIVFPLGLAVDSVTHLAADLECDRNPTAPDQGCDASSFNIYNLKTKVAKKVYLPGRFLNNGLEIDADPIRHLFIFEQPIPGDFQIDNNALSTVLIYNENGTLLKTLRQFNFLSGAESGTPNMLQLNPRGHFGYVPGSDGISLQPFRY